MKCHKCANTLADDARFCRHCGADQSIRPVAEPPAAAPQRAYTCAKCGTVLSETATFCRNCGTKVAGSSVAAAGMNVPPAPPQPPPIPIRTVTPPPAMAQPVPPLAPVRRESSQATRNAIIAAVAVAMLGGLGYGGWKYKLEKDAEAVQLAEEQKRKEEEMQQKIKQAEEKARLDAEEKAQREAAVKLAALEAEAQAARQAEAKVKQELDDRLAAEKAAAEKLKSQKSPAKIPASTPVKPKAKTGGPKSVLELCADRPNFISRGQCESRFCKRPEWVKSNFCVELNAREKEKPWGIF